MSKPIQAMNSNDETKNSQIRCKKELKETEFVM